MPAMRKLLFVLYDSAPPTFHCQLALGGGAEQEVGALLHQPLLGIHPARPGHALVCRHAGRGRGGRQALGTLARRAGRSRQGPGRQGCRELRPRSTGPSKAGAARACGPPSKREMKFWSAALSSCCSSGWPDSCFMLLSSLSARDGTSGEGEGAQGKGSMRCGRKGQRERRGRGFGQRTALKARLVSSRVAGTAGTRGRSAGQGCAADCCSAHLQNAAAWPPAAAAGWSAL